MAVVGSRDTGNHGVDAFFSRLIKASSKESNDFKMCVDPQLCVHVHVHLYMIQLNCRGIEKQFHTRILAIHMCVCCNVHFIHAFDAMKHATTTTTKTNMKQLIFVASFFSALLISGTVAF